MTRTAAERQAIARDGENCLRCGRNLYGIPASVHHRLPRSGGTKAQVDQVANCVLLCGSGTTPGACHPWAHANHEEAVATGWVIRRSCRDLPSEIPLVDLRGVEFLLTDEGQIVYTQPLPGFWPADPHSYITPWRAS